MPFHHSDFCHEVSSRHASRRSVSVPAYGALVGTVPAESGAPLESHRAWSTASRGAHLILCLSTLAYLVAGLSRNDPFSIMLAAALAMIWLNVVLIVLLLKPPRGSDPRLATGNWRRAVLN